MCGVAGYVALRSPRADAPDVVARLNQRQSRRGPDGEGLWRDEAGAVVLGHRRLAIIELGDCGAQPMRDVTGRYAITFNGEIYNHAELRAELLALGRPFATHSDTEVIIQAVAQWGEAAFKRLRGMYALALWDVEAQELWLARDPFGIKPLYVAEAGNDLWFASQARALADVAPVDRRRDPAALVGFYQWGHVPEPFTWWAGVKMFPAGCVQRLRRDAPVSSPQRFYDLAEAFQNPASMSPQRLQASLTQSVAAHLVADVPVGVFLSAGVDSGVLATLAKPLAGRLHTVTLGFAEFRGLPGDEAPAAEALAKELGAEHATVVIQRDEFEAVLDDFLLSMDQPSIDGLNTYLVSRAAASQRLKVMLSGVGADEIFGGYPSFTQIPKLVAWGARVPFRARLGAMLERLRPLAPRRLPPKAPGVLAHAGNIPDAFLLRRALHLAGELDAVLDESWLTAGLDALRAVAATSDSVKSGGLPAHAQIILLESELYMRNQLLRDTDWASMAHGVEVRTPFVDAPLFEAVAGAVAAAAPPRKRDLAAAGGLAHLADRPKTGFTTPVAGWIGTGSTRGLRGWASTIHRKFRTAESA